MCALPRIGIGHRVEKIYSYSSLVEGIVTESVWCEAFSDLLVLGVLLKQSSYILRSFFNLDHFSLSVVSKPVGEISSSNSSSSGSSSSVFREVRDAIDFSVGPLSRSRA